MNDPIIPTTWIQLLGLISFYLYMAYQIRENRKFREGTAKVIEQNTQQIENQVVMHKQLNGATEALVVAAKAAGVNIGKIAGAAEEQGRAAGVVETAAKVAIKLAEIRASSGDEIPVYIAPGAAPQPVDERIREMRGNGP